MTPYRPGIGWLLTQLVAAGLVLFVGWLAVVWLWTL